jgi:hypothetical protein
VEQPGVPTMAFWPSRIDLKLAEGVAEDIDLLAEYADRLPAIIELAKKQEYDFLAPAVIRRISTAASIDYPILSRIFNSLENLKTIADEMGGAERAFRQITSAVDPNLQEKLDSAKDKIIDAIELYDADNAVSISYKAQKLAFLREKLFHEAEIITDARPVFDAKGERILEMVITHSLVMTYWTRTGFETIHLAIDAADVLSMSYRRILVTDWVRRQRFELAI